MLDLLEEKALSGIPISREEAICIVEAADGDSLMTLLVAANRIRQHYRANEVDLCSIISAKSGNCSEDCGYCAQSSRSTADVPVYPLADADAVLDKAAEAKAGGARRFCIVTSGRKPSASELNRIAGMISAIRELGLLPCATLGLLSRDELLLLQSAGLERYHNNLETSSRFFPSICSTHSYAEKLTTIREAKRLGLSLCSGGIFGLGETWDDRIDMALTLREIGADSVPINFLVPVSGTRLETQEILQPSEALAIIALYRFLLPDREIRICGGRLQCLGELNPFIFLAGADGLLIGNYLTTTGRGYEHDIRMIAQLRLSAVPPGITTGTPHGTAF